MTSHLPLPQVGSALLIMKNSVLQMLPQLGQLILRRQLHAEALCWPALAVACHGEVEGCAWRRGDGVRCASRIFAHKQLI